MTYGCSLCWYYITNITVYYDCDTTWKRSMLLWMWCYSRTDDVRTNQQTAFSRDEICLLILLNERLFSWFRLIFVIFVNFRQLGTRPARPTCHFQSNNSIQQFLNYRIFGGKVWKSKLFTSAISHNDSAHSSDTITSYCFQF